MSTIIESSRPKAAIAHKLCSESTFLRFMSTIGHHVTDTESALTAVREIVEVDTLSDIIYNSEALDRFETRVLRPYATYCQKGEGNE